MSMGVLDKAIRHEIELPRRMDSDFEEVQVYWRGIKMRIMTMMTPIVLT